MTSETRLFVGNLPVNTNEKDIVMAFSSFGEITCLDLKSKSANDDTKKNFAFVTLSSSKVSVDECIKHYTNHNFKGSKLYVTRARESFLERLQRERQEAQNQKQQVQEEQHSNSYSRKRKGNNEIKGDINEEEWIPKKSHRIKNFKPEVEPTDCVTNNKDKKYDSESKRLKSLQNKINEFKQKKMIIKNGLNDVDTVHNKKLIFPNEDGPPVNASNHVRKAAVKIKKDILFDGDGDIDDEVNFKIKKQFEGKRGQKVLDLQSRYKSDKRFTLDERFIEDETEEENQEQLNEEIELQTTDEKAKQLNILQDVLGVAIKSSYMNSEQNPNKKTKSKLGMLRFDPSQPEHLKYLAPVEEKQDSTKRTKKKKKQQEEEAMPEAPETQVSTVEVSKEQFYKVSETLKEAIAQPTTFSLRSLFSTYDESEKDELKQDTGYISLEKTKDAKKKIKNPLEPDVKNPFVYDSSDSEEEKKETVIEKEETKEPVPILTEIKAVWKEDLFFSLNDDRFKEGLAFFNKVNEKEGQKERRELKSLMKKRIYNKDRKNQMFQKKIGGRKKTLKKNYIKKS